MDKRKMGQLGKYDQFLRRKRMVLAVSVILTVLVALYAVGVGAIQISIPEILRVLLPGRGS